MTSCGKEMSYVPRRESQKPFVNGEFANFHKAAPSISNPIYKKRSTTNTSPRMINQHSRAPRKTEVIPDSPDR
jgi:hypothetical protein